ncbi:MAG: M20/M25/M40 family metallo-hydrolase [Oscillospiraceae bacterium]|nr:M20/M25/M40 family metallo-hydrolase [Oscillospiraceae bacterium]
MIGWILLGALALLVLITVVRAARFKPTAREREAQPSEKVDAERAARHLCEAITYPTVSYPDPAQMDFDTFHRFHAFLEHSYPLTHQALQRELIAEASLLYTWRGTNKKLAPIALLSHQDVVPVSEGTEKAWTHPPFAGHNDGAFIWGRGAIDMKNHLICVMEAVETLLSEGFAPARTVHLCFGHNEEVVGSEGAGAAAIRETLRGRGIRLESVIDEGGAMLPVHLKGILEHRTLAGIGISEKGYADFEITLHRKGGHSSQPPKHSGLGEMAEVIRDLERHQFKAKMLPFLRNLLDVAGRCMSFLPRMVACNHMLLRPLLVAVLKNIPAAACLMRSTTAVTMASGSPAANVLPQNSSVTVNFRMMPGVTTADVEKHIRKVVRNKDIEVRVLKKKEASPFSPTDTTAFRTIARLASGMAEGVMLAPYLVMGGTDACFYEPICKNVYRFSPFLASVELLGCAHATNERIPVQGLGDAVAFFKRYIRAEAS